MNYLTHINCLVYRVLVRCFCKKIQRNIFLALQQLCKLSGLLYGLGKIQVKETRNRLQLVSSVFFQLLVELSTHQKSFYRIFLRLQQLTNILSFSLFTFQMKIVYSSPTYARLVQTLILYLQAFPQMRPSVFITTTCTIATIISLTFTRIIFVICLTYPPKNIFFLQMVWLWDFLWVLPQLISLSAVMKVDKFEQKPASIEDMLITYFQCFALLIMHINLRSIYHLNNST